MPEFERIYPAEEVDDILDSVSGSLSIRHAETQLGMTRTQLETLLKAGFLRCSLGGKNARPRFSQKDISTFNDRHRAFPLAGLQGAPRSHLTIAEASRRSGKSVVQIYRMIVEGTLKGVFRASDSLLFSEIVIDAQEIAALMTADGHDDFLPMYACVKQLALGTAFIRELKGVSGSSRCSGQTNSPPEGHHPDPTDRRLLGQICIPTAAVTHESHPGQGGSEKSGTGGTRSDRGVCGRKRVPFPRG